MNRVRALAALALAVVACSTAQSPAPSDAPTAPPTSLPTATATTTTPSPTTAVIELPNPGGTCNAAKFVAVGPTFHQGEFAAMGTQRVGIWQQLINAGDECELAQPPVIGLMPATGLATAVAVPNLGHTVWQGTKGHDVYPMSTTVPAGATVFITMNTWWWMERVDPALPSPRPCGPAVENVIAAEVPFATGRVVLDWHDPLKELCTDPPSFSIGVALSSELHPIAYEGAPPPCRASQITLTPGTAGVAAGTAYLQVEARLVKGTDCLLPREPIVWISIEGGREIARAREANPAPISIHDTANYYLGWNTACLPQPTGALVAHVEFSAELVVDMPLGDFGPSCVDGSDGILFMKSEAYG